MAETYLITDTAPITGDSGVDYGTDVINLFKYGVGAYLDYNLKKFEAKTRYETFGNQVYQNGLPANNLPVTAPPQTNYTPFLIIGGVLLVGFILMKT